MDKKFKEIRGILKPQQYSEMLKTNCFGEFIKGDDMISILDYIRRQHDKINFLETKFQASEEASKLNLGVMPRISHFIDENGNSVNINAGGVNVVLKRDGTHEYFRSYGFAGRMQLTPVYVV